VVDVFSSLAPARRRLVIAAVAAICVGAVALGAFLIVQRIDDSDSVAVNQDQLGPVLLVPGYGGSTSSLRTLAARLEQAGRDAIVVQLPGNGTGDLNAAADALRAEASAVLTRTGAPSVDLIGYSAGGIVARLWVADGGADVTRRVITLGSPHHGTDLANLAGTLAGDACPEACQQLATDSEVLRRLNAIDETPAGPTLVSIWTTQDQTVTPPETARLDGAINVPVQSVCADAVVSHSDLASAPILQSMVLAQLGAGPPPMLTSADCPALQAGR